MEDTLLPRYFGYKMGVFPFQNDLKDLDLSCKMDPNNLKYLRPSYKMDLDLGSVGLFWLRKPILYLNYI